MKYLKIIFVVFLIVFCGSCKLFKPYTTYYYVVNSGCTLNGNIDYITPSGTVNYTNVTIYYLVTHAFKFNTGDMIGITACLNENSYVLCSAKPITVTIMKGESTEGATGTGGTVWKTATDTAAVNVMGNAD